MSKRLTTEEFINRANLKYNFKYDYSLSEYITAHVKLKIICPIHGMFELAPCYHLFNKGCPICGKQQSIDSRISTSQTFKQKANKIHNNKYNYSLVDYKRSNIKVIIKCNIHGDFEQRPADHLQGQGCPKCGKISRARKNFKTRKEIELLLLKACLVHNNFYDYSKVEYERANKKICIICPIHGEFYQLLGDHLRGHKCKACSSLNYCWTKEQFISLCENKNNTEPLLYIIKCYNSKESFIKIGITSNSVYTRYNNSIVMPYEYEIIKELKGSPSFVWSKEKEMHKKFKTYKYIPLISFGGKTECFSTKILDLI